VKAGAKKRKPHAMKNQRWVGFFIRRPWLSVVIILALAFSIWYIYPKLETGFLPEMDEGSIVLDYIRRPALRWKKQTGSYVRWKRSW
jgi:multidrug efflux pump subunit AcrB